MKVLASIQTPKQVDITLGTGTAPLKVISTTMVPNLNVDKVDGKDVDDTKTDVNSLWTASKINTMLSAKAATAHAHSLTVTGDVTGSVSLDDTSDTMALTLGNVVTAGTYRSVTVNAKGLVTGGTNPTTLSGHGITDAVKNAGGAPAIQSGLTSARPAAGTIGRLYISSDEKTIYRDTGTSWDLLIGNVMDKYICPPVKLASDTNIVSINAPTFNKDRDIIFVSINGANKILGQDFNITDDGKSIQKIADERGANWAADSTVNIIVLGTVSGIPDTLGISSITSSFTATSDNTTNILINNPNYNSSTDVLTAYYLGKVSNGEVRSVRLFEGADKHYTVNANGVSIDLLGWSLSAGEVIVFETLKKVRMALDKSDGSLLEDGSVTINKLNQSVQDVLSGANLDSLYRNAVINGNFDIWQRGILHTGNGYNADRWVLSADTKGQVCSISRQDFVLGQAEVPNNPKYFLRYKVTTAGSGQTWNGLYHRIEGVDTFAGKKCTLSFWAKADSARVITPTLTQNFGTGGTVSAEVHAGGDSFTLSTAWKKIVCTFTLPSVAGKTLGTNLNDNLRININCPVNSLFTIDIAQVQLCEGEVDLPFMPRSFAEELRMCQRYYEKSYDYDVAPGTYIWGGACYNIISPLNSQALVPGVVTYKVPKRIKPTITFVSPTTGVVGKGRNDNTNTDVSLLEAVHGYESKNQVAAYTTTTQTSGQAIYFHWIADAEL